MAATLPDVAMKKRQAEQAAEQQAAVELVRLAKEQGLALTGPDGLLKQLTKTVIESALQSEARRTSSPLAPRSAACRDLRGGASWTSCAWIGCWSPGFIGHRRSIRTPAWTSRCHPHLGRP